MPESTRPCQMHPELVKFKCPLPHFREALRHQRKVKVVAIGSSSTAGVAPVLPYPSRLEMRLRRKFFSRTSDVFYGRMIDVLNRGIGGQESPEQLSRLETDVIDEVPVLVDLAGRDQRGVPQEELQSRRKWGLRIAVGLEWLAGLPIDVVLMDLQYTTAALGRNRSYPRKWSSA